VADGFVDTSSAGHVVDAMGATTRCVALDTPAFDDTDFPGYGAFEVDDAATPTDVQERSDGDRLGSGGGGSGDDPDYVFTI
jgi:hypothetical protein